MTSVAVVLLIGVTLTVILLATVVLPAINWIRLRGKINQRRDELLDDIRLKTVFIDDSFFLHKLEELKPTGGTQKLRRILYDLDLLEEDLNRSTRSGISTRIPDNGDPKEYLDRRFNNIVEKANSIIDRYEREVDQGIVLGYLTGPDQLAKNWEQRLQSVKQMMDDGQIAGPKQYMDNFEADLAGLVEAGLAVETAIRRMNELTEFLRRAEEITRNEVVARSSMYSMKKNLSLAATSWRMHENDRAKEVAEALEVEVSRRLSTLKTQFPTAVGKPAPTRGEG